MTNKIYIIDTSVCLEDFRCIYHYGENDIVVPLKVMEEIDKHKKRQDSVGTNARNIIREFDLLRERGSLQEGVPLGEGLGTLRVSRINMQDLPPDFVHTDADHVIMTAAITEQRKNPEKQVIIASRDINMRVMTDSLGLKSEDYVENQIIKIRSDLYTGYEEIMVSDEDIDDLYSGKIELQTPIEHELYNNQSIMFVSNINEKKAALCRHKNGTFRKVRDYNKKGVWGIKPRNKEQVFALDMLMDPNLSLVTLVGKAGSGKTLMAIAAGISQTIADPFSPEYEPRYKKLVISRPIQPLGKDIGYLPGTMEEKMHPWLMPIQDNLQYILGNDKATIEDYMEKGIIEVEALTYIRGRSISNAYIIIDESQNLSLHEIKTILTRVGENTKIILTGDVEQIDNLFLDETSNGLVHIVEKFKKHDLSGHMTLQKGERSALATIAAEIL
jgi:PhoH-like ATPase